MGQLGGDFDLAQEALGADGRGDLGGQDLDRHLAVMLGIFGEVDLSIPPAPSGERIL